jgi:hypothetical protein
MRTHEFVRGSNLLKNETKAFRRHHVLIKLAMLLGGRSSDVVAPIDAARFSPFVVYDVVDMAWMQSARATMPHLM